MIINKVFRKFSDKEKYSQEQNKKWWEERPMNYDWNEKKKVISSLSLHDINQIDKKPNKKLAIDIVSKKEINIKSPITINSKSFLLIKLRN